MFLLLSGQSGCAPVQASCALLIGIQPQWKSPTQKTSLLGGRTIRLFAYI